MKVSVALAVLAATAMASALPQNCHENNYDTMQRIGISSPRATFNFGPSVKSNVATDAELAAINKANLRSSSLVPVDHVQSLISYLREKYADIDGISFHVQDSYTSSHNNVLHVYLNEMRHGIKVANGNINANIDSLTGEILSLHDSSYASYEVTTGCGKNFRINNLATQTTEPIAPTEALASFLSLVTLGREREQPSWFSKLFFDPRVDHCSDHEKMVLEDPFSSTNDFDAKFFIHVHPECHREAGLLHDESSPIEVEKVWLHNGDRMVLSYKFTVNSLDNWYEGYVEASRNVDTYAYTYKGAAESSPTTLMAIDWVRDFQPTSGEVLSVPMKDPQFQDEALVFQHDTPLMGFVHITLNPQIDESPRRHPVPSRIISSYNWLRTNFERHIQGAIDLVSLIKSPLRALMDCNGMENVQPESFDDNSYMVKHLSKDARGTYRVFPWGINDPVSGKRELLEGAAVGIDDSASPYGWHARPLSEDNLDEPTATVVYTDTRGNNVWAQENWEGANNYKTNYRPDGGKDLNFSFPLGIKKAEPTLDPKSYIDASVTELFFTNNEIHDLFYRYGFDEVSGNFQDSNFGRGGLGNDAVQANAQDGSGYNNANFATPPDGYRPRMRMYVWTNSAPYRDGDLEAGIVIHEYAHGISTRLTGGPANSGCLGFGEAGGMGEGWGDFFATMIRMHKKKETDFSMGEWASNRIGGIRNYRYSHNLTTNPDTYKSLDQIAYWGVHAMGEVWAEMLFEVASNLVKTHGFAKSLMPPNNLDSDNEDDNDFYTIHHKTGKKVPIAGNTLALQLVVDGLKFQPCRPSFLDARDAILKADKVLTGGENACDIWKGFAKRGLGPKASVVGSTPWGGGTRTEDYTYDC